MSNTLLAHQIYQLFLLVGFSAFIIATIILSFHWGRYGKEIRAIKLARPLYYLGSFIALAVMLWSYFIIA